MDHRLVLGRTGGGRSRLLLRVGVAAVVAALALLAGASRVAAADAAVKLDVRAGWDGRSPVATTLPVRVRIAADRLVAGDLVVRTSALRSNGTSSVRQRVEVAGGSVEEHVLVVPWDGGVVEVSLTSGSTELGAAQVNPSTTASDEDLVGLLPGILRAAAPPSVARLALQTGSARFVAVTAADLDAAGALGGLGALGIGADELGALAPPQREAVLTWVNGGGQLLVDADAGPIRGLPDAWQPGQGQGRTNAGQGTIRLTKGALGRGAVDQLVEPATRVDHELADFGARQVAAAQTGAKLPVLGWLGFFLIAYVLVAGPGLRFVLKRLGRLDLTWLVVPLLAVAGTGAVVVGSGRIGGSTRAGAGVVVETAPGGSAATALVGVSSAQGGHHTIQAPDGWVLADAAQDRTRTLDVRTGNEASVRYAADAGSYQVVVARGPADVGGVLQVHAVGSGTDLSVTVRNGTRLRLKDVAVAFGADSIFLGELAPGQESTTPLQLTHQNIFDGGGQGFFDTSTPDITTQGRLLRNELSASRLGGTTAPDGLVVSGVTEERLVDVKVDGSVPDHRLALVVGRGTVEGGAVTHRLRGLDRFGSGVPQALWRVDVPASGRVTLSQQSGGLGIEVWDGTTWTAAQAGAPLPAAARVDGAVFARANDSKLAFFGGPTFEVGS